MKWSDGTIRKGLKLHLGEFRLDMRENKFTERVIWCQNRLPRADHPKKYVGVALGDVARLDLMVLEAFSKVNG